ncbi:MAG: hypothetical protein WBK55_10055 [Alphaproteobacteria bacterium]
MIYVMGLIGFAGGFMFGQMALYFLLRHRSTLDLLQDRNLRLKYGIINWLCAAMGAYGLIELYRIYYGPY